MFLVFPASESPSECAFSETSLVVIPLCTRISDNTLEALTIIRDYLNQPYYLFDKLVVAVNKYLAKKEKGDK
jgi:hypothetical protein